MPRLVLALLLGLLATGSGVAANPPGRDSANGTSVNGSTAGTLGDQSDPFSEALHQSIGAPARAPLGDQATIRLEDDLVIVPQVPAEKLLVASGIMVPADFIALLMGADGMRTPGLVRFVPAGFIDSNTALAWRPEDYLASLNDTLVKRNAQRLKFGLDPLEARRWVQPPIYDPERHQLSWAALVSPKSAPRESDGAITFHAVAFGRDGYIELTIDTSVEKAPAISAMAASFLHGLHYLPGKRYIDAIPADKRAKNGLAQVMGLDSIHKAILHGSFWASETFVPVAGGLVAMIGALSLAIYIQRHLRRESRRI